MNSILSACSHPLAFEGQSGVVQGQHVDGLTVGESVVGHQGGSGIPGGNQAPQMVNDTPEVAAAREAHLKGKLSR